MDREIEFRGFDGTKWCYGDLEYNRKTDVARIHTYEEDGSYCRQYTVDPDTVGQFTGLCDKNGKRVFEGDVVHVVWQDTMFCQWHERTVLVEFKYGRFTVYQSKPFEHSDIRYFDVIGNIYDNPELLDNKG